MKGFLSVDLAGVRMDNPTMLASGILGYSAEYLGNIVRGGAGAIVTKSVGLKPREGYPNPTVVQVSCGLINAMGLPNPGIKNFVNEIRELKTFHVPVIVSIYGFTSKEYALLAKEAVDAGADAVELNVSCPHVKDTGSEIGHNREVLIDVIKSVKNTIEKPVFVKLSPNVTDLVEIAESSVKAGADALTAINTVKAMVIDVENAIPVLGNKIGGMSGAAIKPLAVRHVYEIYQRVKKTPIIGCGGISNWQDAVEFILAGASAIQIGTAIAEKGPSLFKAISRGIAKYLKNKSFTSVEEIVGLAHKK